MDSSQYIKSNFSVLLYGLMLSTTTIFFGYGVGIFNVYFEHFITTAYEIDDINQQKVINGNLNFFFLIGGTIACLFSGALIDKFGRYKFLIFLSAGEVFTLLLILYKELSLLYFCRVLWGFFACASTFICTLMIKEVIPERYSTQLNNSVYIFLTGGILVSNLMSKKWMGTYWRLILPMPIFLEFPKLICYLFVYKMESPKTIVSKNENPEIELMENFEMIYDKTGAKMETLKQMKELDESRSVGQEPVFSDLLTKRYRLAFLIGLLLNFLNQATGINFIVLYSKNVFTSMKMSNPELLTSMLGLLNFGGAIYITIFGKFHGKRMLLIVGLGMQAFGYFLFLLGICLDLSVLVIAGAFMFMISFSVSLGGSIYPYMADTVPTVGISFAAISQWLLACIVGKFGMTIIDTFGIFNTFYSFMAIAFIGCIVFTGYSVDTDGKTESQIRNEFERKEFMVNKS